MFEWCFEVFVNEYHPVQNIAINIADLCGHGLAPRFGTAIKSLILYHRPPQYTSNPSYRDHFEIELVVLAAAKAENSKIRDDEEKTKRLKDAELKFLQYYRSQQLYGIFHYPLPEISFAQAINGHWID